MKRKGKTPSTAEQQYHMWRHHISIWASTRTSARKTDEYAATFAAYSSVALWPWKGDGGSLRWGLQSIKTKTSMFMCGLVAGSGATSYEMWFMAVMLWSHDLIMSQLFISDRLKLYTFVRLSSGFWAQIVCRTSRTGLTGLHPAAMACF